MTELSGSRLRFAGAFALTVVAATAIACGGGGKDAAPTVTAPAPAVLTTVRVSLSASTIQAGQTATATASGLDQRGATIGVGAVTWSTASPSVATVSQSGVVTGVAVGDVSILAIAGGITGQSTLTVIAVQVATVSIAPTTTAMFVGATQQLTASTRDAAGASLSGRTVTWSASNAAIAAVSASGLLTGVATGGPVTITATSEGKSGTMVATVVPASTILSGIRDANTFVNRCPTSDPAYATIRQDFTLLSDGQPITTPITCTDPYNTVPANELTDELLAMQTFRMAFYLSQGTAGKLPWTPLAFYEWMKSEVAGVNFRAQAGLSACCELISGRKYIITSRKPVPVQGYRDWIGVSNWLALFAHEARHASGPGHVTGCPAFPLPTDSSGCDATYNPSNISSYAIQYWLFSGWAMGTFNVGIGCAPATTAQTLATSAASSANVYLTRFVANAPPAVTAPSTYGGPCVAP